MSYKVDVTNGFKREAKRLIKKYASLKEEIGLLIDTLEETPRTGTSIGHDCYKVRLAITSKGKGKSGGARVITCVFVKNETVYLLSIYDKSEQNDISDARLAELVKAIAG
jgi:mRNA-degrading endonuclease RelE of RelBE toxin-antitoxin system